MARNFAYGYDLTKMKLSAVRTLQKGFTLIELLVVIGILGILAAALVATIDPFEQLNKANDANSKNTAVEFLNANIRYYTTHTAMPWDTAGANCLVGTADPIGVSISPTGNMINCLSALIVEGELKSSFTTASGILSGIYMTETNDNVTMCYLPKSKSQKKDGNTRFTTPSAGTGAACPGGTANTVPGPSCYWCTQ